MTATVAWPVQRITYDAGTGEAAERTLAIETPVALEYNGIGYAVMMATPADLDAFAVGFTLSERLIDRADEIVDVDVAEVPGGHVIRIALPEERGAVIHERVRLRLTEGSCGLCGLDSIEQVLRPLPAIKVALSVTRDAIERALAELASHQTLGSATGATHAAAFCEPDGRIVTAMEDVGRHNALDKLIGALAMDRRDPGSGFLLLTARCSYELVEKAAVAGCPVLVTISAPTSLAVERAEAARLTLVSLARSDSALIVTDIAGRIV